MHNIIVSPEWYPNKNNCLSAIFTKKHVDIISKSNNVIVAFACLSQFEEKKYNLTIEETHFKTIICYYRQSKIPLIGKYIDYLNYFIAHFKAIQKSKEIIKRVDFFHIHVLPKSALIPFFYYLFFKIPYFISEHSTIYIRKEKLTALESLFRRIFVEYSKGLSVVSNSLKDGMISNKLSHKNFKIIPNAVDDQIFTLSTKKANNIIKFLHVSRLEESAKNTIGIIKAFDLLLAIYPQIELHIVGGLVDRISDAEIYTNQLSSRNSIFFHGVKLGADIVSYYHDADYFVMFSNYETQAVVILEALACGIPVIATKLPALNEYLHFGNSLQVEIKNAQALYQSMEACILKTHQFWDPKDISEEIKLKFNIDMIGNEFDDLYNRGLNF